MREIILEPSVSAQGTIIATAAKPRLYRRSHWPFLFPAMFFISLFIFVPAIFVVYLSLFKWNLLSSTPKFVGLLNYDHLFVDPLFQQALANSGLIAAGMVFLALPLSLGLASLTNMGLTGVKVYRTVLFAPYVIPLVASGLVWSLLFNGSTGLVDQILLWFGIHGPNWLASGRFALVSVLVVSVWQYTGYYLLIFLGGLQGVPDTLKDAAKVDGAGAWRTFTAVTLPALSPSIFFAVVVSVIQSLQTFDQVYVMTGGGPDGATSTLVYYIYNEGFGMYNIGPATAAAVILLVILAGLTAVQVRFSQRWVVEEQ